ncbi:MAG: tRNA (adenosine(37)-N6)-threonylcarbamoyltransferase complex ATPase subunit type 1 TsaE [Candidatus Eisenbacteria bacterium]|uniref:tRNA threonylcarbamoyladenosine biosynthesis protein TsaE n=1 Tax=Eiseniibacteriota bacterium TaxID=2212470 RepID=A0A948RVE5_UNCEI|nr:tRNA (adenosine(37)-N6)-threonylcarbamoyltransferase complex ATPase subunit type 1 TsaE [Candidatus Eisenbacteria bacterium]MBU1949274.1 tRNA (adenosine(37)-N6)-threonylcarbamoyltransferase complex ATPase subunit type 1 TsaE [Candidatus Eisenbacteria bacterium]MBU2689682.1 tRNA (adenosine(37)-N6)-threonylcarbamoyltransferase complex ATPase subunit type 1 TsaE [Candidatus Eisenbacteria bacterium]
MRWARAVLSRDEEETRRYGVLVAETAPSHAVVALMGELGTGKTRLVAGSAEGFGYEGRVRSPTFTLMNQYRVVHPLYHFDLYRLPSVDELELAEWEEYWDTGELSLIEWAERLGSDLPERALRIWLAHRGGTIRRIVFEAPMGEWDKLARTLEGKEVDAYPRD